MHLRLVASSRDSKRDGPDWEISGDLTVNLRAERWNKGEGRAYTMTVACTDAAGNTSTSFVTVLVPRR